MQSIFSKILSPLFQLEYILLNTHDCSGGKLKYSSFIRVMGRKKVEKGIGKSVWNYSFTIDPDLLSPKATRNHRQNFLFGIFHFLTHPSVHCIIFQNVIFENMQTYIQKIIKSKIFNMYKSGSTPTNQSSDGKAPVLQCIAAMTQLRVG